MRGAAAVVLKANGSEPVDVRWVAAADVRRLIAAGFTQDQAEAVAVIVRVPRTIDVDKLTALGALREALLDAGAHPDKAARAAEEVAAYETRFGSIEARLGRMEGRLDGMDARLGGMDARLGLMTWAVGINVALTLAVLAKLIAFH
jgi:hypothetical protein